MRSTNSSMKNWKRFGVNEIPKVVFDTQIYLRAVINPNSGCGRLFSEWTAYYVLYVADAIEAEIVEVLQRPKIRARFPQITDETIKAVKAILAKAERIVLTSSDIEPICRDPKDDIFLACAKMAGANYLVSEDNDLLVIGRHHNTQIVGIATFLTVLENRRDMSSS